MRKNLLLFFILFLSVILDFSFLAKIFPAGCCPSLTLVLVIILALEIDFWIFCKWAFVAGLMWDFFSFGILGSESLIFLVLAFFANLISGKIFNIQNRFRILFLAGFIFLGSMAGQLMDNFIFRLISLIEKNKFIFDFRIFDKDIFCQAFWNVVLFLLLYKSIKFLADKINSKEIAYIK